MKLNRFGIFFLIILSSFFCFSRRTYAQEIFSDDFSSGNFEKWQDVRDTFNLWEITDSAAHVFVDTRSTLAELIPKPEYWNQNWKNYSFEVKINYIQGADKMIAFWFQDVLNWYQIHFVGSNYILSHISEGKEVWKKINPISFPMDSLMRLDLEDGKISLYINNLHIFTHTDPTFDNDHGTIALKAGTGTIFPAEVFFDSVSVKLISSFLVDLKVPSFSQSNPLWASEIYNSAETWSPEKYSIHDWGCLISSIAMVLHYHSISHLPSGETINPSTLNAWLNSQEDGYIADGLVNWSAITRLAKKIHDVTGSTKLEYHSFYADQLNAAARYLQESIPVIYNIPGHFLVGTGITQIQENWSAENFLIQDPLYDYTTLSEHVPHNVNNEYLDTPLLSTRALVPSNTDLSYIHIAHSPEISITFTNQEQIELEKYQTRDEFIQSADQLSNSPVITLHEIQKPKSGIYSFSITSNSHDFLKSIPITIFAYDKNGNFTNLSFNHSVLPKSTYSFSIQFSENTNSSLKIKYTFADFSKEMTSLYKIRKIQYVYITKQILHLSEKAAEFEIKNLDSFNKDLRNRYVLALNSELTWFSQKLDKDIQEFLQERLFLLADS